MTSKIQKAYPVMHGKWTGASEKHLSFAMNAPSAVERNKWPLLIHLINRGKFLSALWAGIDRTFRNTEWFIDESQFTSLALASYVRNAVGKKPITAETMLKNPETGNLFYRIGMKDGCILGIRFWMLPEGTGDYIHGDLGDFTKDFRKLHVGFRIRVETMVDDEETLRVRVDEEVRECREILQEAETMYVDILEPQVSAETNLDLQAESVKTVLLMELN